MLRTHRTIARKPGFKQFCLLIAAAAAASIPGLCAPPQDDGKTLLAPGLPREAISRSNAFLVAYDGQSYLFNPSAGIVQAPFLRNVYKPFGFSYNSRYVLYLKSNGRLPTFSLYTYDLDTGTDTLLSEDSVQFAAWSPTTLDVAYVAYDGASEFRVVLLDIASRTKTEVARGYIDPDALDWSADGRELLYVSVAPLSSSGFHNHQFEHTLNRYQIRQKSVHSLDQQRPPLDRRLVANQTK